MSRKQTKQNEASPAALLSPLPLAKSKPRKVKGLRAQDPWLERERERYENPLPSREFILQILAEQGAPVFPDELKKQLSIHQTEGEAFARRLAAMEREGELMLNRKGALCLPAKIDLIAGRVQGHPDGFGFLVPDNGGDDYYLGPREMDKVLHGDRVLVRHIGVDRRGRPEGKIVEVLEHVNTRLVGRFYTDRGIHFVVAENKRISQDILIEPKSTLKARPGQVVTVELLTQPARNAQPVGKVVEILGNYNDPGMEIEIALRKHSLPHEFSEAAEAQAAAISQTVTKKDWKPVLGVERVDLRELPLVTIDGETAKDFDDAVFAEKKGKGWRLVVAIADVSHYVLPDDALDETAFERGNSVYFPRRVIPMLPEALSNGICSLNPAVERLCMVCDMQISQKGEIKDYRFYPAVMLSKARLTYNKVWDMLSNPQGEIARQYANVLPHINNLYALFKAFSGARQDRGAIDFETTETMMLFDENGKIREIVPVVRNDAHKLIEECMLAANVCAAHIFMEHKHTGLYRVHEGPTPQKLEKLREYLRGLALALPGGELPEASDYATLLGQIKDRPDAPLLQTMLLRSLQQAVYSPDNLGHFGLGYEAYTHFTSPIRRYPDLLVHRTIKAIIAGKKYKPSRKWEALGVQCSMTERRADEASRDVENWLKCYYMQDKIGEEFDGVVASVTSFGLFVLLEGVFVEGLVHISELGTDYFHYDEVRHELRGERSGQVYRMTDRVRIKVVRVDMDSSKIDFVLVEDPKAPSLAGGRSAKAGARKTSAATKRKPN
ncbi:MAG: ribonuclease R [Formivibrio sp.]|nr:ribonuclease R [Formivibrio sp.]